VVPVHMAAESGTVGVIVRPWVWCGVVPT